jgi:hypothetical protein
MTARIAVAIASSAAAVAVLGAGCSGFYEIPVETPIQARIDVASFQRVLVAGFLSGGSSAIDANTETARLLRSQLRSKQDLRVIDADPLLLVEEVDRRLGRAVDAQAVAQPARGDAEELLSIRSAEDLATYEQIFEDAEYWKQVGADYQDPLIVTGSVLFTPVERSGMVSRPDAYINELGQEQYRSVRAYSEMKGYALTPKFVFIDGSTGEQLYSEEYHEETLYPTGQNTPALSSYFELMDKLLPSFLNTLSTQKIRGSRILLK